MHTYTYIYIEFSTTEEAHWNAWVLPLEPGLMVYEYECLSRYIYGYIYIYTYV
jgi:hypothetical protein